MKIKIEVDIPDGQYCNQPNKTGCQFLDGVASIGRCFCKLFKVYLDNESDDYTVCSANLKCIQCLEQKTKQLKGKFYCQEV